jgi:chemotaxis protein histidine kinase CheA
MSIQDFYGLIEADYEGVKERLLKDERIEKYVLKFAATTDYDDLKKAIDREDYEEAFRAAHTIKGLCLNLGFTKLQQCSSELSEALRGGKPMVSIDGMLADVKTEYAKITDAVNALKSDTDL